MKLQKCLHLGQRNLADWHVFQLHGCFVVIFTLAFNGCSSNVQCNGTYCLDSQVCNKVTLCPRPYKKDH